MWNIERGIGWVFKQHDGADAGSASKPLKMRDIHRGFGASAQHAAEPGLADEAVVTADESVSAGF